MKTFERILKTDDIEYRAQVTRLDQGIAIVLGGGVSHIGTVILAEPRPSLQEDDRRSATSSVINRIGHLDEEPVRKNAERLAASLNVPVVVTGGIHVDDIAPERIASVLTDCDRLFQEIEDCLTGE